MKPGFKSGLCIIYTVNHYSAEERGYRTCAKLISCIYIIILTTVCWMAPVVCPIW